MQIKFHKRDDNLNVNSLFKLINYCNVIHRNVIHRNAIHRNVIGYPHRTKSSWMEKILLAVNDQMFIYILNRAESLMNKPGHYIYIPMILV